MTKEENRLASLYNLEILDTPPDNALDELTNLASQIAGTPIALVSLIDKDRQWFKSRVGLDATETPREVAFCHHAIEQDEIYIVEDSRENELFSENPLVTGAPHVIFYAGIPLKMQDGSNIGTLCVINREPQKLTIDQIDKLKIVAKQAIRHIELNHKVNSQLRISQMLQRLHGLSFGNKEPIEEVINKYLTAGSKLFDLEFAIQSKVVGDDYIVESAVSPGNVLEIGAVFVLKDTYCAEVLSQEKTINYLEVAKLNHMCEHPVYINMKLESYISTPIWNEGKLYGTLNFSSQTPKKKKFSKEEITFVEIMSDLISRRISFYKQQENLLKTREEAINASKYKSDFLANMSHEIRTPMNGILGNLTLLEDSKLSKQQMELLSVAKQSGDGLLSIINDVLDLSKIESGKMGVEKIDFNIRELITEVVSLFEHKASEKDLKFSVHFSSSIPEFVIGDSVKIKQVLLNFISNAFKFTKNGSIKLFIIQDTAGGVLFSVKDSGQGIEESKVCSIFEPFIQEDSSTTRKFGGTGLGLTISSKLVDLMSGDIKLESKVGKGSTFSFLIPLPESSVKNIKSKKTISPSPSVAKEFPHTILVAEDNVVNQNLIKAFLLKLGYQIDLANNGVMALEMAKMKTYTLIFMDIQMPKMDGFQATKELLEHFGSVAPSIIALTANVFEEDRQRCLEAGMTGFVPKPFEFKDFINAIELVSKKKEVA